LSGFAYASEAKRELFRDFVESDLPGLEITGTCETDIGRLNIDGTIKWGCPISFDLIQTYWIVLSNTDQSFADVQVISDGAFADTAADGSYGSGCSPGSGPLPDGIWFGLVAARDTNTFEFDQAYLLPDPEVDTRIVNESSTLRSVPVDDTVLVTDLIGELPIWDGTTYGSWQAASCYTAGPCPAWVRILDGQVIYIAEQFFS
jgi:hypothetical protein